LIAMRGADVAFAAADDEGVDDGALAQAAARMATTAAAARRLRSMRSLDPGVVTRSPDRVMNVPHSLGQVRRIDDGAAGSTTGPS